MNNLERFRFETVKAFASATNKEIKQFFEALPCLHEENKHMKLIRKLRKLHSEACEKGKYKGNCPDEVEDCRKCEEEWLEKECKKGSQISNREELARLILENPELPVLCMVEYEIVAGDDCNRWAASIGECKIREYTYTEVGYCDSEVIFWREEAEKLVDALAEDAESRINTTYEEARQQAWEKVNAMPWKKAIVVNIDLPEEV